MPIWNCTRVRACSVEYYWAKFENNPPLWEKMRRRRAFQRRKRAITQRRRGNTKAQRKVDSIRDPLRLLYFTLRLCVKKIAYLALMSNIFGSTSLFTCTFFTFEVTENCPP